MVFVESSRSNSEVWGYFLIFKCFFYLAFQMFANKKNAQVLSVKCEDNLLSISISPNAKNVKFSYWKYLKCLLFQIEKNIKFHDIF